PQMPHARPGSLAAGVSLQAVQRGHELEAPTIARASLEPEHARSSGHLGQGVRFVIAGCVVGLVYLGTTTGLADVVGLPFQAALAIGFWIALAVHFTLQRLFVWRHAEQFALSVRHQVARYLLAAGAQYGLTAASTALLPRLPGVGPQ